MIPRIGDKIQIIDTPLNQEDANDAGFRSHLGKIYTVKKIISKDMFTVKEITGYKFFFRDIGKILNLSKRENFI